MNVLNDQSSAQKNTKLPWQSPKIDDLLVVESLGGKEGGDEHLGGMLDRSS